MRVEALNFGRHILVALFLVVSQCLTDPPSPPTAVDMHTETAYDQRQTGEDAPIFCREHFPGRVSVFG